MATRGQQTGMRAVYLVAAELSKLGFIVSPTSRSAFGADLLVTNDSCTEAYSVQVKANNGRASFWLLNAKAKGLNAKTHIYVFVNLDPKGTEHEYYVVPSSAVAQNMCEETAKTGTVWYSFERKDADEYKNAWARVFRGSVASS
jgi:hypothetical protein